MSRTPPEDRRDDADAPGPETCWTRIHKAAGGCDEARTDFVERYRRLVLTYLQARWRGKAYLLNSIEDTAQDVFLDCLRDGGALERVDQDYGSGFRGFLYGIVRRAAQKVEKHRAREVKKKNPGTFYPERLEVDEDSLSCVFDREWAHTVMKEAHELHEARAKEQDEDARRRVELLRLRIYEGQPNRAVAAQWGCEAKHVQWAYERARKEFMDAMRTVLGLHERCPKEQIEKECNRVLDLLR